MIMGNRIGRRAVRIAKPLLLITTPIGLAWGLYEAYRLAGGLVILMAALIAVIAAAMGSVILTIRREREAERRKDAAAGDERAHERDNGPGL
jgi:hypothetical protein